VSAAIEQSCGGPTTTSDELTGNFGSALEDTSIGDCRLVALFAEKTPQAIFGVLQHNRHIASFRCAAELGRCRGIADVDQTVPINLDLWYARRSIYPDGRIAHAGHAKIARRVTVSQAVALAPSGKSGPLIPPSRATRGASRSSRNVVRDAMDVAASNDE
jgi:hypothetical protein